VWIFLNPDTRALNRFQHAGRGIAAGNAGKIRGEERHQFALAASHVQIAEAFRVDRAALEIIADQISLAQVKKGGVPGETVADRVLQQFFVSGCEVIELRPAHSFDLARAGFSPSLPNTAAGC
jgi:hypothetical protein